MLSSSFASARAMAPTMAPTRAMPVMQTKEELATALNPAVGYCAPTHFNHRCVNGWKHWHSQCSS